MKIPARYLKLGVGNNLLFDGMADAEGHPMQWPPVASYPPLGFLSIPLFEVGNGDVCGFYWPIGKEEEEPILCDTYHDSWSLEPVAADLEGLVKLKVLEGWYAPDDEEGYEDEEDDEQGLMQAIAHDLNFDLPQPHIDPPPTDALRLATVPDSPVALKSEGKRALDEGRPDEAEALLRRAVSILPEYTEALFLLVMLYRREQRQSEAAQMMVEVLSSPLCLGSGRNQCLQWLKHLDDQDYPELQHDPLWAHRHRLTFKTGVKVNDDFLIYEEAIEEYLKQGQGIRAIRLRILVAELMWAETVSFRERYGYSHQRHDELLLDNLQRAGLQSRADAVLLQALINDKRVFRLSVQEVGRNRAKVFAVLRQVMNLSPAETKALMDNEAFEVMQGKLADIQRVQKDLKAAGATVEANLL